MSVVYDAGVLVAAERSDRRVWADHRVRLEMGAAPVTTAPVVAQVSRSPRQVQLRRFLRGCEVVAVSPGDAHDVGALPRQGRHLRRCRRPRRPRGGDLGASMLTADVDDLSRLAGYTSRDVPIVGA